MRPRRLKISGLNSFVEEEEIDFTALTEKGLFGIFGPTGSGKSSILDAVTIALYGKISRDTKEFINKEREELYVFFSFTLGTDNIYTVERKLLISDSGGYKTSLARLVVNESGQEEIYDKVYEIDKKIEDIIGLNHEDFMRTVVLPQGKFSHFLKLTGRDRRDMLERILGLEEFGEDLMRKLKKQRNSRNERINQIEAVLNKYEQVSEEKLVEEKGHLKDLSSKYKTVSANLKKKKDKYDKYRQVRRLQNELKDYEERKERLEEQQEVITIKTEKLERTRKAVSIKADIDRYIEWDKEIKDYKKGLKDLKQELSVLMEKKKVLTEEYNSLEEKKDRELPELTEKKVIIKTALELAEKNRETGERIKKKELAVKDLKEKQEKLKFNLAEIEEKLSRQQTEIEDREEKIEELQVSSDYRKSVGSGLELENKYNQMRKQLKGIKKDRDTIEKNIENEKEGLNILKKQLQKIEAEILSACNQEIQAKKEKKDQLESDFKGLEDKIISEQKLLDKINQEISEIKKKNLAGILALELEDGEACPVCGSLEHPEVAEKADIDLTMKEERKQGLERSIQSLQEEKTETLSDLKVTTDSLKRLTEEKDSLLASFENDIDELKDFIFDDKLFPMATLKTKRNKTREDISTLKGSLNKNKENLTKVEKKLDEQQQVVADLEKQYNDSLKESGVNSFIEENRAINKKDKQLEELQQELKYEKQVLKNNREEQEKIKREFDEKEKELAQELNRLEVLKNDFRENQDLITEKVGDKDPEKYLHEVELREEQLKGNLKNKKIELKQAEETFNKKQNRKSTVEDRLEHLGEEWGKLQILLDKKIAEFDFENIDEAGTYLKWEGNIEKWEEEIKAYQKQETEVKNNIKRLTEELAGDSISSEQWEELEQEKLSLEGEQEKLTEKIGGQKKMLERLKEDLEDKNRKEKEKSKLERELALIAEINDLVRGKSFVEFVAVRQLRYIAREASDRLMEITNNRYRLELNEQGEFIICDLYNGGAKRGCNTLSGGETFLTSLSLALALSSQIQLKGSSNMEFFFLDEGFGTLDSNLLDIVMNSLEKLQGEKLAVGIISHVEELKNRVPVKLLVRPAEPGIRGTEVQIEYS